MTVHFLSLKHSQFSEALSDGDQRLFDVVMRLRARDDELPTAEEQEYNLRIDQAVDEPRKLFRFIFNVFKAESDGDGVEI